MSAIIINGNDDDVSVLFSNQVQQLLDIHRGGNLFEARRRLRLLRHQIASVPRFEKSQLVALLEHIEKDLLNSEIELPAEPTKYSEEKPALARIAKPYSASSDNSHFELLRNEYSKISSPFGEESKSVSKQGIVYKFDIANGARPTVYWGKTRKQVLGKNGNESNIPLASRITVTTQKLPENSVSPGNDSVYVVTPSFNSAKFIDSTVLSVASQEGPFHIYYHVQDGGSTDSTVEKLIKWQELFSDPGNNLIRCQGLTFTFQSEKDAGLYEAINKGFESLAAPDDGICTWINSDDVFTSGAFASARNIFVNNSEESWLIGATCGCDEYLEEISFQPLQFPQEVIRRGLCDGVNWRFIQQEGSFWRNKLWAAVGGLDTSLKYCGDWDLWKRFASLVDPVQVEWVLGKFRIHQSQLTSAIEHYYQEMNEVIPEVARKEQLENLRNVTLAPTKIVKLPNRKGTIPIHERIALQNQYVGRLQSDRANSILDQMLKNAKHEPLKVLTLNTLAHSGAGTGSLRRIAALRNLGVDVKLLSLVSELPQEYVGRIEPTLDGLNATDQYKVWHYLFNNIRNQVMNLPGFRGQEMFSLAESLIDLRQLKPLIDEVDVVHLHWVVGMLDYENMPSVLARKPIVWTTADMNSFTGGCHYSEGCMGFMKDCSDCPMLSSTSNLPHDTWKIKKRAYESLNITVVCPSEHMASIVRRSSLLGDKPVQVISNAYPIDRLFPVDQIKARKILNLPLDKKLLLFGAESLSSLRKGGDLFHRVAELLHESSLDNEIEVVFFGSGSLDLPLKVNRLGSLSEDQLSEAYSAADVFISLSREDVGPMTVVESLLCGTPVVGFPIGVLPEVVVQKSTGYVAEPFDVEDIINGIEWALGAIERDTGIGERCRRLATEHADPRIAAEKHKNLYRKIRRSLDVT